MPLVALVLPLLLLVLMGAVALAINRWQRQRLTPGQPGQPLPVDDAGGLDIPVLGADLRGGFGSRMRNSINPRLRLTAAGLAFKVLRQDVWPYDDLIRVHAGKSLFGATLDFETRRASLHLTVPDLAMARQALAALPRTAPLTPKAAALRDDGLI